MMHHVTWQPSSIMKKKQLTVTTLFLIWHRESILNFGINFLLTVTDCTYIMNNLLVRDVFQGQEDVNGHAHLIFALVWHMFTPFVQLHSWQPCPWYPQITFYSVGGALAWVAVPPPEFQWDFIVFVKGLGWGALLGNTEALLCQLIPSHPYFREIFLQLANSVCSQVLRHCLQSQTCPTSESYFILYHSVGYIIKRIGLPRH